MKKRKPKIKGSKVRGEWAEMKFMTCAAEHGLCVSKPWGDSSSYDFVVGHPRGFVSVQVKSTTAASDNGYTCTVRGAHKPYPPGSFDFLAAYVVFEDAWYIIPEGKIKGKFGVTLFPKSKKAKYEKYREASNLLRGAPEFTGDIQACAEEFPAPSDRNAPDDACRLGALIEFTRYDAPHLISSGN
jgi:PD-(D/E)XK endonuclease